MKRYWNCAYKGKTDLFAPVSITHCFGWTRSKTARGQDTVNIHPFCSILLLQYLHLTFRLHFPTQSLTKPLEGTKTLTFPSLPSTISPKTSGSLLLSLPSKSNSRHFSSQNISVKPHCPSLLSVCTVCVCVCACACVRACVRVCIFCIIMLEHLSIYTFFYYYFFG